MSLRKIFKTLTQKKLPDSTPTFPQLIEAIWEGPIFDYCESSEQAILAAISPELARLGKFKFAYQTVVNNLLASIEQRDLHAINEMIAKNHALILKKCSFKEKRETYREFKTPISPLIYAAWLGDTEILLNFIEKIPVCDYRLLLSQLKEAECDVTDHGRRLQPVKRLIATYEKFEAEHNNWTSDTRAQYWFGEISEAQAATSNLLLEYYLDLQFNSLSSAGQMFGKEFTKATHARSNSTDPYISTFKSGLNLNHGENKLTCPPSMFMIDPIFINWQADLDIVRAFYQQKNKEFEFILRSVEEGIAHQNDFKKILRENFSNYFECEGIKTACRIL